jgi:ssDNA-binding replication factor A large subunit
MKVTDAASPKNVGKSVDIEGRITEPVQAPERGPLAVTRVGDDSGDVRVVVWERELADVLLNAKVGDQIRIRGEIKLYQGITNLNVGRSGLVELLEYAEEGPAEAVGAPPEEELGPPKGAPPAVVTATLSNEEIAFVKKLYSAMKSIVK